MRVYFDENFSRYLAHAINSLEQKEGEIEVLSVTDFFSGTTDEELIPLLASMGAVLVTKDNDFKKIQHHVHLMREHKLGVFFFKPTSKGILKWDEIQYIIKAWPQIRHYILNKNSPPYLKMLKTNGKLEDLEL
jgi:hypothetical protein